MAKTYTQPAELSAIDAKLEAQKIAFAPIAFEAVICMLRLGVLRSVADAGNEGASANDISAELGLSEYGVAVPMTQVNLNFACLANGVSRMYNSKDIIAIAQKAGFGVVAQHDEIGTGHTLLHLTKGST
jgi:hypothetical protein